MTRILLTGAAGFLGRACVPQLRNAGFTVITSDMSGDVERVGDLSDAAFTASLPDVDVVIHAAAVQYVTPGLPLLRRGAFFERNNVAATRQLALRYRDEDALFVNVGTSMMYAQDGSPTYTTHSRLSGQGVYSDSKVRAWQRLQASRENLAMIVPSIIGGPGRYGLFKSLVGTMQRYGIAVLPGPGEVRTHMVHVQDVAALIRCVVEQRANGVFNAAGPEPLSIRDWVREIAAELNLARVRILSLPLAPISLASICLGYRLLAREQLLMLTHSHVLDTSASAALGWRPQHTNAAIARETARHIAGL